MDQSNGYEQVAASFIKYRGEAVDGVGTSTVRKWSRKLSPGSAVLDLGCGSGIPISKIFIDAGMSVYGIDASESMVNAFKQNFPDTPVACESVEDSSFYRRKFDAIIAWGLLFLLSEETQATAIKKAADSLQIGGHLLFTAPALRVDWKDVMTGLRSVSLGSKKYRELLCVSGLSLIEEFDDEGENHYFSAIKS